MGIAAVSYALPMSERPREHRSQIAEARNVLGQVIARARYAGEPTILVNRGKDAAVIVAPDFYEQALSDRQFVTAIERAVRDMPEAEQRALSVKLLSAFQELGVIPS